MHYQITVLAVGKLREPFWRDAAAEYAKRLSGFAAKLEILEIAEEPTPEDASPAQEETVRKKEGERLLAKLPPRAFTLVCDARGETLDSPALARTLERLGAEEGVSHLAFVLGGPLGLSAAVRERADRILSFGPMTFPHQLLRVMLLEQLYRAAKIAAGQAYHK